MCPKCNVNVAPIDDEGVPLICDMCAAARRRSNLERLFLENKERIFTQVGIPKEFWKAHVSDKPALEPLVGKSVMFVGSRGVGKTHSAVALLASHIQATGQCAARFVTTADLLMDIRSSYKGEVSEQSIVNKYTADSHALILDDLGAEKTTEWTVATLGLIIDHRYREQLLTIVTTNLEPDELGSILGDRITSRLVGMCSVVHMRGRDRRCQKGD